jgi:hypothetical protein
VAGRAGAGCGTGGGRLGGWLGASWAAGRRVGGAGDAVGGRGRRGAWAPAAGRHAGGRRRRISGSWGSEPAQAPKAARGPAREAITPTGEKEYHHRR